MRTKEIIGERFGRLVVKARAANAANGNARWSCVCDCGTVKDYDNYSLTHHLTNSCGCLRSEEARARMITSKATQDKTGNHRSFKAKSDHQHTHNQRTKRNRSGNVGVSFDKRTNSWIAKMMVHGKLVLNKRFPTEQQAIHARREAERRHYHNN